MVFTTLALGVTSLAMMRVAARLRGGPHPADAAFPLLLLNWGHVSNLLWGFQVQFSLSLLLASAVLLLVVRAGDRPAAGTTIFVGVCLLLLPLCGGPGLVFVPPVALWLAWAGLRSRGAGTAAARLPRLIGPALGVAAVVLLVLYFVGYEQPSFHPAAGSLWEQVRGAVQFLSSVF